MATLQEIKDKLENAREYAASASSYADDAEGNASSATHSADQAVDYLDQLMSEVEELVGFNPEVLREHTVLQQRFIRLQAYLAKRCMDIIDGDGVDSLEQSNIRGLITIIDRLVELSPDGVEINGWDSGYHIRWNYNDGSYVVERKDANNG